MRYKRSTNETTQRNLQIHTSKKKQEFDKPNPCQFYNKPSILYPTNQIKLCFVFKFIILWINT